MSKKILKKMALLGMTVTMILSVGCTSNPEGTKEEENKPKVEASAPTSTDAVAAASEAPAVTDLEWDAQPEIGVIKGDYYKIEERFRQGHLGTLEVVKNEDKIVKVEFNELTRPNYYKKFYQNAPKRYSEYNFDMGAAKGAAWIQSVVQVEKQMLEEQRITGEFDAVAGASNSINQSMVPLAEKLEGQMSTPSAQKFYSIAEILGEGLTGQLKVIIEDGKILSCRYDEIFANSPDDITDPKLKQHYRQSKYESVTYHEPSRIGFNVQMDALNEKVVQTQDMFDLTGLPAIEASGDYGKSGYTERNTAWDNYLMLAEKLFAQMQADGVLK